MAYPNAAVIDSPIGNFVGRVTEAFTGGVSITPADADLAAPIRGLVVGVAGNVKVTMIDGTTVTLYCLAGVVYNVVVKRVWATGTAATGIVGLY